MSQDLSNKARALVALAKQAGSPEDADVARARAVLMSKVGVGVAAGAGAVKTASAAAATKALAWSSISLTTKIVFVAALVGGVAGGYAYVAHRDDAAAQESRTTMAPSARIATASRVGTERLSAAATSAGGDATDHPDAASLIEVRASANRTDRPREHASAGASSVLAKPLRRSASTSADGSSADRMQPSTATPTSIPADAPQSSAEPPRDATAAPTKGSMLADDIRHLREAQRALVQRDAARARDEARLVRKDSPLAEDAEGMEIVAACSGADPAEGQRRATEFARRRPDSSLLARIQSVCSR